MRPRVLLPLLALLSAVLSLTFLGSAMSSDTDLRTSSPTVPDFSHVVLVVFENKEARQVVGNPAAPTFNRLMRKYASFTRYFAVDHPSLPNYLALVSGSTHGIENDCTTCVVDGPSLATALGATHRTWKSYAEGLPSSGFTGASFGDYVKAREPFLYFENVLGSERRLDRIVPLSQFGRDLAAGALPDFALVVPDLCNSSHSCPLARGDAWLRRFLKPLLADPRFGNSVVFVVFDEGRSNIHGGGHIAGLALGPLVRPGAKVTRPMTHYDLLRTIEAAWGLPPLGLSASAKPITSIWR